MDMKKVSEQLIPLVLAATGLYLYHKSNQQDRQIQQLTLELLQLRKSDVQTLRGKSKRKSWIKAHPTIKEWAETLLNIQCSNSLKCPTRPSNAEPLKLYNAAENNEFDVAQEAVFMGYKCNDEEELHPKFGTTPLMEACFHGNAKIVKLYIEHNANLNVQSGYGWTALHYACQANKPKCAELLVAAGCNRNLKNSKGKTAHFRSVAQGKDEIATLIADPVIKAISLKCMT